jgi:hypothetical protein
VYSETSGAGSPHLHAINALRVLLDQTNSRNGFCQASFLCSCSFSAVLLLATVRGDRCAKDTAVELGGYGLSFKRTSSSCWDPPCRSGVPPSPPSPFPQCQPLQPEIFTMRVFLVELILFDFFGDFFFVLTVGDPNKRASGPPPHALFIHTRMYLFVLCSICANLPFEFHF